MTAASTALLTDRYELTMLDAALADGVAEQRATFEVFARRLPADRGFAVFAGLDRLVEALLAFRFGPAELSWLSAERVVSDAAVEWLADFRFSGSIDAYREGELFTAGSPVLTVEAPFGEAVLLETLVLSILNHDCAVASAAAVLVREAGGRPLIEMGSRRTDPAAAVAAARAAYLAGFASTSNLEAGRRFGIPTAGTAAHAFTLVHRSEREAFRSQVATMGVATTLLVDTYDLDEGLRNAVAAAGSGLGAVRIDSGDLAGQAWRARRLLDDLGARGTRIVVTGDLDDHALRVLADAPVDGYGVGTNVVTGLGAPTAGLVYKLVAVGQPTSAAGPLDTSRPVSKRSPGKATVGGRKQAWRVTAPRLPAGAEPSTAGGGGPVLVDVVASGPWPAPSGGRALQAPVMVGGEPCPRPSLAAAREHCRDQLGALPEGSSVVLLRVPPPARPGEHLLHPS